MVEKKEAVVSICSDVKEEKIQFAVIAARFQEKWIFCRHKQRSTWEIPGGHREAGEAIEDTAKRELYEETGATEADIREITTYCVEQMGEKTYGRLYFALVKKMDTIPKESEIGTLRFESVLPKELTYPGIQPQLWRWTQKWLNLQTNAEELWDVYDENRKLTGKFHRRGDLLKIGEYHLSVHVWIQNTKGEFLLTKRSPNKGYPNMWESTGGAALAGDDSLAGAIREVKEETGLDLDPKAGTCILSFKRDDDFVDVWLFQQEYDLDEVILQEGETCDKRKADANQIKELIAEGVFVPYEYMDEIFASMEKKGP